MPTHTKQLLSEARAALASPIDFEAFLAKLSAKDRTNAQRHLAAVDEAPEGARHGQIWRRLVCSLMTLAPHAVKFNGQQSVQFFIPDGKYRMQVFAIEDLRDGKITLYCPNALDEAISAGLLSKRDATGTQPNAYMVAGTDQHLTLEQLDGATPNPASFYKDMLGWNRKALRITLSTKATNVEVEALETLCALSAQKWQPQTA